MTLTPCLPRALLATLWLVALGAPFGCAGSPPKERFRGDVALAEASDAGRAAFGQDRIEQAVTFYTLALKRARALDDPAAIGDTAYNLAACHLRLRQYDRARALLGEAGHELARCDAPLADVLLLDARAAHQAGDVAGAGASLRLLRTDAQSRPEAAHNVQASILVGQMAGDRGDWPAARDALKRARQALMPDPDDALQAQLAALAGRIATEEKDLPAAAEAFDRQGDMLRRAGQYRALGAVLARAGETYAALNEHDAAADRLYRAARTAAAWGQAGAAKKWADAALAAARRANNDAVIRLVESLLSEFKPARP